MAQPIDLDEYLPYLVNRLGAALAAEFEQSALVRHRLTIATWRDRHLYGCPGRPSMRQVVPALKERADVVARIVAARKSPAASFLTEQEWQRIARPDIADRDFSAMASTLSHDARRTAPPALTTLVFI